MSKEFALPDLGEGIDAGDVVAVHVSEGDTISSDKTVVEVETDKAVLEVPCPFGGKVTKVHVKQGEKIKVGQTLITVDADGGGEKDESKGEDKKKDQAAPEDDDKAAEKKPEKQEDQEKDKDEKKEKQASAKSDDAEPSKKNPEEKKASTPKKTPEQQAQSSDGKDAPLPAGPATRRLARELGVNLYAVADAFPDQRITEDIVKEFVKSGRHTRGDDGEQPRAAAAPLPDFTQWGEVERKAFSSLQRKTAEHLHHSWVTAPHVTQFDEADISALETLRKKHNAASDTKVKLTVTAFAIKAAVAALKRFPQFNTSLDLNANELVFKQYYHIGIAVDTEAGLIVPVIRDADRKSLLDLAAEMNETAERTRLRKVGLDELRGGTFTITNLGGIGGTAFTPIVNYPEVAILGIARTRQVPAIQNGELVNRPMLPLCLSYDHRVINGADGARFLRRVAMLLESPDLLLLES